MSLLRKLSAYLIFESDFPDLGFFKVITGLICSGMDDCWDFSVLNNDESIRIYVNKPLQVDSNE